jgi:hypothetical protein
MPRLHRISKGVRRELEDEGHRNPAIPPSDPVAYVTI